MALDSVSYKGRLDWWRFWVATRPADWRMRKAAGVCVIVGNREFHLGIRLPGWKD